ncbi:hypothetical protein JD844_014921, partial [Phrynosoma platyrhinos]
MWRLLVRIKSPSCSLFSLFCPFCLYSKENFDRIPDLEFNPIRSKIVSAFFDRRNLQEASVGLADEINFEDFLTIMSNFRPIEMNMDEEHQYLTCFSLTGSARDALRQPPSGQGVALFLSLPIADMARNRHRDQDACPLPNYGADCNLLLMEKVDRKCWCLHSDREQNV